MQPDADGGDESAPAAPNLSPATTAGGVGAGPRPTAPAALLRSLGLRPRKGLSQSFLTDPGITRSIADAAGLRPTDQVLEIGPGLGILTRALAERAARVVAFELDSVLAAALPTLVPPNVTIVHGDALTLNPGAYLNGAYKLVANLPYQITSPVLFRYLSLNLIPDVLVVMIQREVAERIVAGQGSQSFLAVAVQSVAVPRIVRLVPPGAFFPRPKVESAVIRLDPLAEPLVPPEQRGAFLELARAGFTQPRKQLVNSLGQGLGWPRAEVVGLLERAGLSAERRPRELTLAEWRTLFRSAEAVRSDRPEADDRRGRARGRRRAIGEADA